MEVFLVVVLGVLLLALLAAVLMFNSLIARRNDVANAYASVDAQLQKRYDLIPRLVSTVKGYAAHEQALLERVTQLRSQAQSTQNARERLSADAALTQEMPKLLALSESYPELQASANFLHLQKTLNEVEEQLAAARRAFDATVTDYNNAVETFPSSLIAGRFNFHKTDWFQIDNAARQAPSLAGQF